MKGDVTEEQSYFIGAIVIGLLSLVLIFNLMVAPFTSDSFRATKMAATISFYIGAFSILEADERGEATLELDSKYDIEFNRLSLADIDRAKDISKTFARAGMYVTASAYKKDGNEAKRGNTLFIIVDDAEEAKFSASEYLKIIKEPGKKVRLEYL